MRAASEPGRRAEARLLVVDGDGWLRHVPRSRLGEQLRAGDLLVANDAATLPASLRGRHEASGGEVEVRLAGRRSLAGGDVRDFTAVVFGAGDHRTRTERRPPPPPLAAGDALVLGVDAAAAPPAVARSRTAAPSLRATVLRTLGHPRLVELRFAGSPAQVWAGIARHGRPIQYAHVPRPLALWDVWTPIAAVPAAFEPPSAGFALDWATLGRLAERGVAFATLTHAAGVSSTGDPRLDARLPLDEPYRLPAATVLAVEAARRRGGLVVAAGTTTTRALEHAAAGGALRPGPGVADQRIGPDTELRVVDAVLTGVHEPGESHWELLRAFAGDTVLRRALAAAEEAGYRGHELGDSLLVFHRRRPAVRPGDPASALGRAQRSPAGVAAVG